MASVDARLAAQAAAAQSTHHNHPSSSNTPHQMPHQPGPARHHAAPPVTAGQAQNPAGQQAAQQQPSHHHHHHHHHHYGAKSRKELDFLASLPSRDQEAWYDSGPSGNYFASGVEEGDLYDDGDVDYAGPSKTPHLSNRGNKLGGGSARSVRKGRLGGWENYELFESRSMFPSQRGSSSSYLANAAVNPATFNPHTPFERKTAGGYPITPDLSFVPATSTAAGRADRDLVGLPPSHLTGSHKRKRDDQLQPYSGLAAIDASSATYTSAPVRAYLPMPPQNPIEFVTSPLVRRTFTPKTRTLEKLAISATDMIEQDLAFVHALTRLTDFLSGNSIPAQNGTLALPFLGDDEKLVQPDVEQQRAAARASTDAGINGEKKSRKSKRRKVDELAHEEDPSTENSPVPAEGAPEANGSSSKQATESNGGTDKENDPLTQAAEGAAVVSASHENAPQKADTTAAPDMAQVTASGTSNGDETQSPRANGNGEVTASVPGDGEADTSSKEAGVAADAMEVDGVSGDKSPAVQEAKTEEQSDEQLMSGLSQKDPPSTDKPVDQTANALDEPAANGNGEAENPTERNNSPTPSEESEEEDEAEHPPLVATVLPESVLRIADPKPYIESLFVSDSDVHMAIHAAQGTEVSTAVYSGGVPSGREGTIPLSSDQQRSLLRECTIELQRFLADTLEYRKRLGEIRDSTLGIERRRKAVWRVARGYAHQLIHETQ